MPIAHLNSSFGAADIALFCLCVFCKQKNFVQKSFNKMKKLAVTLFSTGAKHFSCGQLD